MAEAKSPNWLELVKSLAPVVIAAIGIVGTIWGASLGYENKEREFDIRMVEIALSILRGEATEASRPAREYAIQVLRTHPGEIELAEQLWRDWAVGGDVPFTSVQGPSTWGDSSINCFFPRADYAEHCAGLLGTAPAR
jgi:hypothetical protein